MKIDKYFQSNSNNEITSLLEMIEYLHKGVNDFVDTDMTRLSNRMQGSYEDFLKHKKISVNPRDPYEVLSELTDYFGGAIRWQNPGTMINVNPPANIPSIAASAYAMLFNPNFAQDMSTGTLLATELEVSKIISDFVGWDWKQTQGLFTFGGKSTNMHAVKIALQKALGDTINKAIKDKVFIISSIQGHPCHAEVCGWLGIGQESLIRVPVDKNGTIDVEAAEIIINTRIAQGEIFGGIILNGGTTIQLTVDPIYKIVDMRDRIVEQNKLKYIPHLHVDSVIGWAWLLFKNYDFELNKFNFSETALEKIKIMHNSIKQLDKADSFGVDFHKTGFCPYISSMFMLNDRENLPILGNSKTIKYNELEYGNYSPFEYTLELSRSSTGPIAAFMALHCFGEEGFQQLIGNLVETGEHFKKYIVATSKHFEIVNDNTKGHVTLFIIKPEDFTLSYNKIKYMSKEEAEEIGKYNYHFYLFMLEKQFKSEINFVLDYSSGYDKTKSGTKIGVFKAYHMSPFITNDIMENIANDIIKLKKEYDEFKGEYIPREVPHKPRQFVLR